jgi:hypothetical protein
LNAPVEVLEFLEDEIRIGGFRKFDHLHYREFQLIIYSGERLIIGLDVEALYEAPFIKCWLEKEDFVALITKSGSVNHKTKLNLARWALSKALANAIRDVDCTVQVHTRDEPLGDNSSQVFLQGEILLLMFPKVSYRIFGQRSSLI